MSLSRSLAKTLSEGNISLDDVMTLLTKYRLLALLPSLLQALKQIASSAHTQETMKIESPFALSQESILAIQATTGNPQAPHITVINKNILAGFKATYRGMLYDGSAERIIRQLTK